MPLTALELQSVLGENEVSRMAEWLWRVFQNSFSFLGMNHTSGE